MKSKNSGKKSTSKRSASKKNRIKSVKSTGKISNAAKNADKREKIIHSQRYSSESINFIIPIIALAFLGMVYVMSQRAGSEFVSFILIAGATLPMIYWIVVVKRMTLKSAATYAPREQDTKNWVYDLIKGDKEFVFVAEVPGPEDKIAVRLVDDMLYIRGSSNFSKEIRIENTGELSEFKYRNGVLTLRIKRL